MMQGIRLITRVLVIAHHETEAGTKPSHLTGLGCNEMLPVVLFLYARKQANIFILLMQVRFVVALQLMWTCSL